MKGPAHRRDSLTHPFQRAMKELSRPPLDQGALLHRPRVLKMTGAVFYKCRLRMNGDQDYRPRPHRKASDSDSGQKKIHFTQKETRSESLPNLVVIRTLILVRPPGLEPGT